VAYFQPVCISVRKKLGGFILRRQDSRREFWKAKQSCKKNGWRPKLIKYYNCLHWMPSQSERNAFGA